MAPSDPIFRVSFVEGRNVNHLAGNMKSETAFRISGLALSCVKMLSQSDLVHPNGRVQAALNFMVMRNTRHRGRISDICYTCRMIDRSGGELTFAAPDVKVWHGRSWQGSHLHPQLAPPKIRISPLSNIQARRRKCICSVSLRSYIFDNDR